MSVFECERGNLLVVQRIVDIVSKRSYCTMLDSLSSYRYQNKTHVLDIYKVVWYFLHNSNHFKLQAHFKNTIYS